MYIYTSIPEYEPYVDIIRRDLHIPDNIKIRVKFRKWDGYTAGKAWLYKVYQLADISIERCREHTWLVQKLMHELLHIAQMHQDKLTYEWVDSSFKNGKPKRGKWVIKWNGIIYPYIPVTQRAAYDAQPWEVEAIEYENAYERLFPGALLPRRLIGVNRDAEFYKIERY